MSNEFNYPLTFAWRSWAITPSKSTPTQLLLYLNLTYSWWRGSFTNNAFMWNQAANTTGFGSTYQDPTWVGNFNGSGITQLLFFSPGDQHWWLGIFSGSQLNWTLAGNTSGFGDTSTCPTWVGDFTGSQSEILFFYPGDKNWWLGTFSGNQLNWTLAGNTSGFGDTSHDPTWVGDFTGIGKAELLFFSPGDQHWWLGIFSGNQLNWTLAGTTGFGDTSKCPTWVGDFTGSGKTEILFYYGGDGNWWLGTFTGNQLNWTLAGNTSGFGDTSTCPTWIGDFTGTGKAEVLFFHPGDQHWWLGTFSGNQLNWTLAGATSAFGDTSTYPTWIGDFTGSGKTEIMFYYSGDGNWWLGTFSGNQLNWALVANTKYTPPPPTPPPPTFVPNIVNLLDSNAFIALQNAHLQAGFVYNPTGEYRSNMLVVTAQNPSAGTKVPQGSAVNYAVALAQQQPQKGVKQLTLFNCDTDNRTVYIWVYNGNTQSWQQEGQLNPQYSGNICPAPGSTPINVTLASNTVYQVVAVDVGNINCGENNPANPSCQRWSLAVNGDANGQTLQFSIT